MSCGRASVTVTATQPNRSMLESLCKPEVQSFSTRLSCVSSTAGRLIDEMRSGVDIETHPSELDNTQITRLHQLLHEAKFKDPDGSHLSPAGLL